MSVFTSDDCAALRRLARDFTEGAAARKADALSDLFARTPDSPEALVVLHDTLLFLLAYPHSPALHDQTEALLARVADLSEQAVADADGGPVPDALHGSGLPGTGLGVTFNLQVTRWLARCFPDQSGVGSIRGDVDTMRALLGESLPAIEFETLASPTDEPSDLLAALGLDRQPDRLGWLVGLIDSAPLSEAMRRRMFTDLRAFIRIESRRDALSRMALRGLDRPLFCHEAPLARREDGPAILDAPLPDPIPLDDAARNRLLTAARGLLALLGRQTDPISDCDGQGVYAYDLGRGVVIGLFSAAPADRPPLDSHVGMMLFKNGMPVAYGGGWPFLGTCKIGINIFEPYRGGESHFLFLSVLRAYRHLFGINRFIVERYQFGRNNPEGIESGAYWFYYRLGFRSMSSELAAQAEDEWAKIAEGGHRTARDVLEAFTETHMELRLPGCPDGYAYADPADLSKAVTRRIAQQFAGDRAAFRGWAAQRLGVALPGAADRAPHALADLGPALALIADLPDWPQDLREAVTAVLEAREAPDERDFFTLLAAHDRLVAALRDLC